MKKALIICGPTASGKTELAHKYALHNNGEIINADSMQVYKDIPIITASPDEHLRQKLPYHLYNFREIKDELSSAEYANLAAQAVQDVSSRGSLPVIVGGSGMYINMLAFGYSPIPDISEDIRNAARRLQSELSSEDFFAHVQKLDPKITEIFKARDSQRLTRALEVYMQTGKSITEFQKQENIKLLPDFDFKIVFLNPERKFLYETCNNRFLKLLDSGSIAEAKEVLDKHGELQVTAMKALGLSEIISYIKGNLSKDQLIELASAKTRQYAKRQTTWFKNQIKHKLSIDYASLAEYKNIKLEEVI